VVEINQRSVKISRKHMNCLETWRNKLWEKNI
jgi:hypothetical protein